MKDTYVDDEEIDKHKTTTGFCNPSDFYFFFSLSFSFIYLFQNLLFTNITFYII